MEIIPIIFILIFMIFFMIFSFKMAISLKKSPKKLNSKLIVGRYKHVTGLDVAENASCSLYLHEDKVVIESSGLKFNLFKEKILDVSIKTEKEISKHYVSSSGGAIAGNAILGPVGALIGGRIKEKSSTISTNYLIYTYKKDGNFNYIVFDTANGFNAYKFVNDFLNNNKNEQIEITL